MLDLAFIRNKLGSGRVGSADLLRLQEILTDVRESTSPFRYLFENSLLNALEDIHSHHLKRAALELDFVHNLDLGQSWEPDYAETLFYLGRLPDYIGEVDDLPRVKRVIELLGQLQYGMETDV